MTDALGNEIIVGNWYGYSRSDGGHSHTTLGKALKVTPGDGQYNPAKVRLGELVVKNFLYGKPTDHGYTGGAKSLSMATYMVFPVPAP